MNCPKCNKPGPHFVGPSFGEAGFYICEQLAESEANALADDANREMGLPEGEDWGDK